MDGIKLYHMARLYRKSLPTTPEARLLAIPPDNALFANEPAWLKRSQREKANVFVIVSTKAMAKQEKPG